MLFSPAPAVSRIGARRHGRAPGCFLSFSHSVTPGNNVFCRHRFRHLISRGNQFRGSLNAAEWALVLLVAVLPAAIGLPLTWNRYQLDVQAQLQSAAGRAVNSVDRVFGQVDRSLREAAPLAGLPCAQARGKLVSLAAFDPYIRSLGLLDGRRLYCTSVLGAQDTVLPFTPSAPQQLIHRQGSGPLYPKRPFLMRSLLGERGQGIVASVELAYFSPLLPWQADDGHSGSLLVLNHKEAVQSTLPGVAEVPGSAVLRVIAASRHYPLAVHSWVDSEYLWRGASARLLRALLLLLPVGVVGAALLLGYLRKRGSVSGEILLALRNQEFLPYYQPVFDACGHRCMGVEVLLRWQHPRQGLAPPDLFIPVAEASGMIIQITRYLMRRVAADMESLSLPDCFFVALNLSPSHLQHAQLVEDCQAFLQHFSKTPPRLVLEVTEREPIRVTPQSQQVMAELRRMRVQIAIDDFGTGHSSLAELNRIHADHLKIDRVFVAAIGSDSIANRILEMIIDLAKQLRISMVAEGVETEQQRAYLQQSGVHYLQGYLLARPMPLEQLRDFLWGRRASLAEGQAAP
ncbi:cyclic diguanylate phosphodiesterase [Chromobacterium sp. Rain0013]|nr:cyclic diguanylate phosphodiesterase [Chromobacterium sp. Rain0013]